MKKALVTGGGGFIGLALTKELIRQGIKTTVVGRNKYPAAIEIGANSLVGDLCDREFLLDAFAGHDLVFHVAAKAGVWGSYNSYYRVNYIGTKNVVSACKKNGIRSLVYTSTPSVVFNRGDISGSDETLPYADKVLCHYAKTKIMAEKLVLEANSDALKTTALRPHLVWGPGDTNLIPRLLARGRERSLRIVGDGKNLVDISYIDNVVSAHILAARNLESTGSAAGEAFFISQGEPVSLWAWINSLFIALDIPQVQRKISFRAAFLVGSFLEIIYSLFQINNEPKMTRFVAEQLAKSHFFSIEKAKNILNYHPEVSTSDGLDQLIECLRTKKNNGL